MKKTEYEAMVNRVVGDEVSRLADLWKDAGAVNVVDVISTIIEQIPVTSARVTTQVLREAGLLEYDPE